MIEDIQARAAELYAGGWQAKNRDKMQAEYDLTDEEADALAEALVEQRRLFTLASIKRLHKQQHDALKAP